LRAALQKPTKDDTWTISNGWFLCPTVPEWINSRNYPYGYNYQFLGNARPKGGWASGSRVWINYPVPSSRIRAASDTVMITDSIGTAATKGRTLRQGYYADGTKDPDAVCNKGYLLDPPRLTNDSDRADVELPANYRSGPDARHAGKVNVAFCDGHVTAMDDRRNGIRAECQRVDPAERRRLDGRRGGDEPALLWVGTGQRPAGESISERGAAARRDRIGRRRRTSRRGTCTEDSRSEHVDGSEHEGGGRRGRRPRRGR